MKEKLLGLKEKLLTREVITYLIAGLLTTLVNYVCSFVMFNLLGIDENITTIVSWLAAVIFAYVINNSWVFLKGNQGFKAEVKKISTFFGARFFTLIVEEGGILLFSTKMGIYFWLVKIPLSVIVIILNYIFSKFVTFSRRLLGQQTQDHNENT